jgi:dTDP-4-amino-4,6-dideoxygalactose transaminase
MADTAPGYRIPLFDLNFDEEEERAVVETLRSRWISTGPRAEELERAFAGMLRVEHAVALSNCTVALHLAMKIAGVGDGDEVICPSLTFVATVNAVRYVNGVPVFCDIVGPDDLTMDPEHVARLVTPRTRAIVVMHFAGFPCDMRRIMDVARRHRLVVIEDACHGPLSEYDGACLGTIGDIGCFSFFSNKNISTGEGGMLVTRNAEHAARARLLRSHGMTSLSYERAQGHSTSYDVVDVGYNYRLDDLRASLGLSQLRKLRADLERRAVLRQCYLEALRPIDRVVVPFAAHAGFVSNYIFPIVLKQSGREHRDGVRARLHEKGIQTSVHYPAVHRFGAYRALPHDLPNTDYATDAEITLPLFGRLSEAEVRYIAQALAEVLR